jgi:hypothetical protein
MQPTCVTVIFRAISEGLVFMSSRRWAMLTAILCFVSADASSETIVEKFGEWEFGYSTEIQGTNHVIFYSASLKSETNPNAKLEFRCNALTGFARIYLAGLSNSKTKGDFVVTFAMDNKLPKQIIAHNEKDVIQFGSNQGYFPPDEKSGVLIAATMSEKLEFTTEKESASFKTSGGREVVDKLVGSCNNFSLF